MRPVWSGGISFGLIYIPVNLYTATSSVQIDLDLLSKKEHNPIRYARVDVNTGKEVDWKDVVKGFEYQKGDYVVLDDEDFDKVALHRSKSIELESFVSKDDIDQVYYEKPYYLEPQEGAEKTYFILWEALKKTNKVGVAEFIFKNRERVCSISAEDKLLQLNQLRYHSELKDMSELKIPKKVAVQEKELALATQLIESMSEKFDPADYKDDYISALKKIIEAKKHNKPVKVKKAELNATDVSDVIKQLEASLKEYSLTKNK